MTRAFVQGVALQRGATPHVPLDRAAPFPFMPMLTHTKSPPGGLLVQVPNRPGYRVDSSRLILGVAGCELRRCRVRFAATRKTVGVANNSSGSAARGSRRAVP